MSLTQNRESLAQDDITLYSNTQPCFSLSLPSLGYPDPMGGSRRYAAATLHTTECAEFKFYAIISSLT